MAAGVIIALWVVVMAIIWAWLVGAQAEQLEADGPPVDPHAAAVEEFRRELHDWDRRGGNAG